MRGGADRRLEHHPKHVEDEHVEADVEQAHVQEAGGDDPPELAAAGDRPVAGCSSPPPPTASAQSAPFCISVPPPSPDISPPPVASSAMKATTLIAISVKVAGAREKLLARFPGSRELGPPDLRAVAGALGAAHADRRGRHAVAADRPLAARAGDVRLAVGVPVAAHRAPKGRGVGLPVGRAAGARPHRCAQSSAVSTGAVLGWRLPPAGSRVTITRSAPAGIEGIDADALAGAVDDEDGRGLDLRTLAPTQAW